MDNNQRHKRLRLLVSRLNKERKHQAKKTDILCHDIIAAQKNFITILNNISFAADFYETIVGITDVNKLLYTASELIKNEFPRLSIAFFLRDNQNVRIHLFESDQDANFERKSLENCFSPPLVESICRANQVCTMNSLFAMGLQGNLNELNKISATTIPLGRLGTSSGFILVYCSAKNKLINAEVNHITAITSGLSQAIKSCQTLSPAAD